MNNLQRKLSQAGAKLIESFEGCVLHPYNDPYNATIGVGHLIHFGPFTDADVRHYAGFTYTDAIKLLDQDVQSAELSIREQIHVDLNQHQWDALVDLVYNCGPAVLEGLVGELINNRLFAAAADAWQHWDHADGVFLEGLARRRQAEYLLWLTPEPAYMPADEARWETEYDRLTREHKGKLRCTVLRRVMTKRRKEIWHVAQKTGWTTRNRADRYRALLLRTE
jgi:lysozyme